MPFEISPKIVANPWVIEHPQEAAALTDLAAHIRSESVALHWDFKHVWCGTAGCALGHAPEVESCRALGFKRASNGGLEIILARSAFRLECHAYDKFFTVNGYDIEPSRVRPRMVADRIDHWLATGEIK